MPMVDFINSKSVLAAAAAAGQRSFGGGPEFWWSWRVRSFAHDVGFVASDSHTFSAFFGSWDPLIRIGGIHPSVGDGSPDALLRPVPSAAGLTYGFNTYLMAYGENVTSFSMRGVYQGDVMWQTGPHYLMAVRPAFSPSTSEGGRQWDGAVCSSFMATYPSDSLRDRLWGFPLGPNEPPRAGGRVELSVSGSGTTELLVATCGGLIGQI